MKCQESQKLLAEWLFFQWPFLIQLKDTKVCLPTEGSTSRPTHHSKQLNCDNSLHLSPSFFQTQRHAYIFFASCSRRQKVMWPGSGIQSNLTHDTKLITYSFLMCVGVSPGPRSYTKKHGSQKVN